MFPPWSSATIYQIFPLSFYDSDNNGKGDLKGIIQKLDYIASLGVDTIWLNPIYPSTWVDAGYDILNHTQIDPIFGTMQDLDQLIKQAHRRKLKIMLDLLPNHTSDQHPWFIESASSKVNPKRGWYTWRDPSPDGGPPNNWKAVFGGSAWTFDATTKQYYLHTFYPQQPDLDLQNPHVRKTIKDIMRFYLERGVDAFRIDAVSHFAKDPQWRDNPLHKNHHLIPDPYEQQEHLYDKNLPGRFEIIKEFSDVLDEYSGTYMITESYLRKNELSEISKKTPVHNHTACNFYFIDTVLDANSLTSWINSYLSDCAKHQAVPTWIVGNHDRTRIASRLGHQAARLIMMLQMTLPGVAFLYYGDEIGMTETLIPLAHQHDQYQFQNRDAQRTPMQWNTSLNAGYTKAIPWLPIHSNYPLINVETELQQKSSMLNYTKQLLQLRVELYNSEYTKLVQKNNIISFERGSYQIFINTTDSERSMNEVNRIALSTYCDKKGEVLSSLRPFEGAICSRT